MFKSQLITTSPHLNLKTTIFVENIFDTVKKAKATKASESKSLSTSFESNSSDVKKRKVRKVSKTSTKQPRKTATTKKKASLQKLKKEALKTKRKKDAPAKTPRKYTKRATKGSAVADIDDEEAAFILSSISQRSFDSFYNRLNGEASNKIEIPVVSDTNLCHNVVLLDHNYHWMPNEVQAPAEKQTAIDKDDQFVAQDQITSKDLETTAEECENQTIFSSDHTKTFEINNNKCSEENSLSPTLVTSLLQNEIVPSKALNTEDIMEPSPLKKRKITEETLNFNTDTKTHEKDKKEIENKIKVEQTTSKIGAASIESTTSSTLKKDENIDKQTSTAGFDILSKTSIKTTTESDEKKYFETEKPIHLDDHEKRQFENAASSENIKDDSKRSFCLNDSDNDDELERFNWEKIVEFHRISLEKLTEKNRKFAKSSFVESLVSDRVSCFHPSLTRSEPDRFQWKNSSNSFSRRWISETSLDPRKKINSDLSCSFYSRNIDETNLQYGNDSLWIPRKSNGFSTSMEYSTPLKNHQKHERDNSRSLLNLKPVQDANSCSKDPRLNPLLIQKEENETPKKKRVSLTEYRKRVLSLTVPISMEKPEFDKSTVEKSEFDHSILLSLRANCTSL